MKSILEVVQALNLNKEDLLPYGEGKAKIRLRALERPPNKSQGKLILVTAMSPSPSGEGKTTVAIGLSDALNRMNHTAVLALREPSMGPVFGMKGGGTGAGKAQVVPSEIINLHFTGDFHAVTIANNLLSAALDNHIHRGNLLDFDLRRVIWHRVMDMNDRALRKIVVGLGGKTSGFPREDRFDITAASEVMAILSLSRDYEDLKRRLGNIVVGFSRDGRPILARELNTHGSMTALLRDALLPNLVQTLEGNPAIVHTGPFANIAHGTSSVLGTLIGLRAANFVVQEAGFGSDLGGEKFLNIFCRVLGVTPSIVVVVVTLKAIKYHGGLPKSEIEKPSIAALYKGMENVRHHLNTLKSYGIPVVVALNVFDKDTSEEIDAVLKMVMDVHFPAYRVNVFQDGGKGASELAEFIAQTAKETKSEDFKYVYDLEEPLIKKVEKIVTCVYGGKGVEYTKRADEQLRECEKYGYRNSLISIAKTQYSLSDDPKALGKAKDFMIHIREVYLLGGAEFIVPISGDIMTMPGLPKTPNFTKIDLDNSGNVLL
jgi:formate--tetrahydrofolate ligase